MMINHKNSMMMSLHFVFKWWCFIIEDEEHSMQSISLAQSYFNEDENMFGYILKITNGVYSR